MNNRITRCCALALSLAPPCLAQENSGLQRPPSTVGLDFPIPEMTPKRTDVKPLEYDEVGALIPNYLPSEKWGTLGDPISRMQRPLDPAESMKHFVTPVGFKVELFAAEPDVAKPLCMAWDERGRLWIGESTDYPNDLQPPGKGHDRIKICEDTDGDGRADKFTVFAETLSIPTSITFANGGAIVHAPPETLWLKDTDGDDRADEKKVILRGWGTDDTHAGPSNLQLGHDNWVYGMVGYSGFRGTVGGERMSFRQGFYRFKPDGSKLEFLRSTSNNTWGIGLSEEGLLFGSTANRSPSEFMAVPNRYYEQVKGWSASVLTGIAEDHYFKAIMPNIRQVDHHGGYTAAAGHALYTARTYPREYWNRVAFVTDGTGHLAGAFVIDPDGAGYRSAYKFNLLASDDDWSSPITAEVGPDGHVWVIDWYNYIVQHNPTPAGFETGKGNAYVTPLRDKTHGRIYRVVYEAAQPEPRLDLSKADPRELVRTLAHPNLLWRRHAQRLLVERGKPDVAADLIALVNDKAVDEIGLNVGAIHALHALQGLGLLAGDGANAAAVEAAAEALGHPSAAVRLTALQVAPPDNPAELAQRDADPRVRLAAILALADSAESTPEAGQALAKLAHDPSLLADRWLADALTSAAANNAGPFLAAWAVEPRPGPMLLKSGQVGAIVAEHLARGEPAVEQIKPIVAALAKAEGDRAEALLTGLADGWPDGHTIAIDPDSDAALAALLAKLSTGGQAQLAKLATALGSKELEARAEEIAGALVALIGDAAAPEPKRAEAARQLISFRPDDVGAATALLDALTPQTSPELAASLLDALRESRSDQVGPAIVDKLAALTPGVKAAALRLMVGRAATTRDLLDAAEAGKVALADLTLDQKQALAAHPDRALAQRAKALLAKGGGLPNPDREKVVAALLAITHEKGDPKNGFEVFKTACAKCHKHNGEGAAIGPDLTGMAVHPKEELLTQILDPSRSVEGTYRAYTVATADGRVLNGMLASETKTTIELVDTEAKTQVVQRDDIEELRVSDKSLMPEGFEGQVTKKDLTDLLEFLTQKGKWLPLDLGKVATVVSTKGMFFASESEVERLIFPDWNPKTVEGVPFVLVDPKGDRVPNVLMLNGPNGTLPPNMPKSVTLPVHAPAKAIHFLSGISGWGAQGPRSDGTVSMIVRIHYADGQTEDVELYDGKHFADYIGPFEVPESKLAFRLRGQQVRYFAVHPARPDVIDHIDLIKGEDRTAPVVVALTVEAPG